MANTHFVKTVTVFHISLNFTLKVFQRLIETLKELFNKANCLKKFFKF